MRSTTHRSSHTLELARLLAAAVVSQDFRNLLLSDPALALATGYYGTRFSLGAEEEELIRSYSATSLADLAAQLTRNGHTVGGGNGLV